MSSPDDFLLDQLELYPAETMAALRAQSAQAARPSLTPSQLLDSLRRAGAPDSLPP